MSRNTIKWLSAEKVLAKTKIYDLSAISQQHFLNFIALFRVMRYETVNIANMDVAWRFE